MSFERFFETIDKAGLGAFVAKKQALIEQTDPERIYVENVRSFFGLSHAVARQLCKLAVRRGVFEERKGYLCPEHQNIIQDVGTEEQPEPFSTCGICQALGRDNYRHDTNDLRTIEYFRLRE